RELGMALTHEQRGGSFGPSPTPSDGGVPGVSRPVHFDGEWLDTPILRGTPEPGYTAQGPVLFELPEATLVLPPGWSARVDEFGSIIATRPGSSSPGDSGDPERTSPQFVREGSPESPPPRPDPQTKSATDDRPDHPPSDDRRPPRRHRGDGRHPHPLGLQRQHQGAPRPLDRALRRSRRAGDAGGAHSGPPRLDARRGRR